MAISELAAAGTPTRSLISSLFLLYNALLTLFGISLFLKVISQSRGRVSGIIGSVTLVLVGIAGLLMELAFPQEPGGTATTFAGAIHFVMAGLASLGLKCYGVYSIISVASIFVSGGLSAAAMANHPLLFGLIERIRSLHLHCGYLLWFENVSLGRKR